MPNPTTDRPSRRRIVFALSLASVFAIFLSLTILTSNSIDGRYQHEREKIRLVAVEGQLHAFDRGEHPEIDGYSYDDPDAAAAIIAEWRRAGTRTNLWDRHKAIPTHYEDPGHEWIGSTNTLDWSVVPARIDSIGITLPWIRVVTMEFSFGMHEPMRQLYGFNLAVGGPSSTVDYLRRHAPDSDLADRLAKGIHIYPRLELEPRFVWIPIAQLALLISMTISLTLSTVWTRRRCTARPTPAAERAETP